MSEYVEARHAKLVLREAWRAKEDEAAKLVNDLLRDLGSVQRCNSARAQALTSIRLLALSLDLLGPVISMSGNSQIKLLKLGASTHFTDSFLVSERIHSRQAHRVVPKGAREECRKNPASELKASPRLSPKRPSLAVEQTWRMSRIAKGPL